MAGQRERLSGVRGCVLAAAAAVAIAGAGCSTFMAVRGQQDQAATKASILGTVAVEGEARGPLYVGLVGRFGDEYRLIDYFVAQVPGSWAFAVDPGTYWIAAFEDANGDGRYDDEPALRIDPGQPIVLGAGDQRRDVALAIPAAGRFERTFAMPELLVRDADDQRSASLTALSVAGQVTTLDDPRFSREKASEGMWRYYDFIYDVRPGIYFLQEYDPAKIPVLYVHGIGGTPLDFFEVIAGLDRSRFQPWVFYDPSGAQLDRVAAFLGQLATRLRTQYRIERMAVVAHSMGGLVSRQFLLEDFEKNRDTAVQLYITISSPLGGMPSAGAGVRHSPVVVHSWRALAPGSAFLDGLYYRDVPADTQRRRLPAHTSYHMLFGYKGESGDGVVPLASQLRAEAQEEARSLRGFDADHTGILHDPEAIAHLNRLLGSL